MTYIYEIEYREQWGDPYNKIRFEATAESKMEAVEKVRKFMHDDIKHWEGAYNATLVTVIK